MNPLPSAIQHGLETGSNRPGELEMTLSNSERRNLLLLRFTQSRPLGNCHATRCCRIASSRDDHLHLYFSLTPFGSALYSYLQPPLSHLYLTLELSFLT